MALKKFCRKQGCKTLVEGGYCEAHKQTKKHSYDNRRGSAAARGYDHNWREARAEYLRDNPLCVTCREVGTLEAATHVDHITPHRGDKRLFWDRANWQGLCASCHSTKTAKEDGGFDNGR